MVNLTLAQVAGLVNSVAHIFGLNFFDRLQLVAYNQSTMCVQPGAGLDFIIITSEEKNHACREYETYITS
jgi:hypothetical protein